MYRLVAQVGWCDQRNGEKTRRGSSTPARLELTVLVAKSKQRIHQQRRLACELREKDLMTHSLSRSLLLVGVLLGCSGSGSSGDPSGVEGQADRTGDNTGPGCPDGFTGPGCDLDPNRVWVIFISEIAVATKKANGDDWDGSPSPSPDPTVTFSANGGAAQMAHGDDVYHLNVGIGVISGTPSQLLASSISVAVVDSDAPDPDDPVGSFTVTPQPEWFHHSDVDVTGSLSDPPQMGFDQAAQAGKVTVPAQGGFVAALEIILARQ
jgi:hypothetical protein